MRLLLFEIKKLLKRRTTWFAVGFTILAVIVFYFFNYAVAQSIYQSTVSKVETYLIDYPEMITQLEKDLAEAEEKGDQEMIDLTNLRMDFAVREYEKSQLLLEGFQNEEWSKVYPYMLEILDRTVNMPDPHMNIPYEIDGQPGSWYTLRVAYEEMKLLHEGDIPPFIQMDQRFRPYIATIYEDFQGKAIDEWKQLTFRYGVSGFYFLYQIIQAFFLPIILLIACFIFGNTVSLESGKKRRGLNFYAALPIAKGKLFFAKYISGFLLTLGFYLLIIAVPLVVSLFTKGLGNPAYPVLLYEGTVNSNAFDSLHDPFSFIELGDYLLQALLLGSILSFFIYSLYFLLSLFIKNPAIVLAILGTIGVIGILAIPTSPYNPLTYIDIHQVLNGAIATLEFNPEINFQNGGIALGVMGILFIILSYIRFARGIR